MNVDSALKTAEKLVKNSKIVMLGTLSETGFPNIKAMFNVEVEGLTSFWLSTNTSSKRVKQLINHSKSCLYFVDEVNFVGLMLLGTMEIRQDAEARKRLWTSGDERYYPQGIDDPDYTVLHFSAEKGNLYHGLETIDLDLV